MIVSSTSVLPSPSFGVVSVFSDIVGTIGVLQLELLVLGLSVPSGTVGAIGVLPPALTCVDSLSYGASLVDRKSVV